MKKHLIKFINIIKNLFIILWTIFCFIGIIGNCSDYGLIEWLIIIPVVTIPYLIVLFLSNILNKGKSSNTESDQFTTDSKNINYEIDKPVSVNNKNILSNINSNHSSDKEQETSKPAEEQSPYSEIVSNQDQNASERLKIAQAQLNTAMQQLNEMIASGSVMKVTVQKSSAPKEILTQMQTSYSDIQGQNDIRILKDCVNLMNTTNNIETFFSRYELAMEKALTLEQAKQAGININTSITSDYVISLKNRADYVLQATYNKELEKINELKTTNGKRNRIDKFISFLSEYQDEFEFSNVYRNIIDSLNSYKKEL